MREALPLCVAMLSLNTAWAQDPPEKAQVFCDPADPANRCPGETCRCSATTMEITFDGDTDSVFQYESFVAETPLDTTVIFDTKSADVRGWSYGVKHDDAFLTLQSVTIDGTDAEVAKDGGFFVADATSIDVCEEPPLECTEARPGSAYISAVILSFTRTIALPVGRNTVCVARYTLKADAGAAGALIFISNRVKKRGSPLVEINLTEEGTSQAPVGLVDGWVKKVGNVPAEHCNNSIDDDGDGKFDCLDRDCTQQSDCKPTPEQCTNQRDDDLDGRVDCDDSDCVRIPPCAPPPEVCDNGVDDDRDERTDCEDTDCAFVPPCLPENCANEVDDDGDGATDCEDAECTEAVVCRPEICDNGVDDNANAMTDCYDQACRDFPGCEPMPEICDNLDDEDFDGKIDCSDPDCDGVEACKPKPEICDNRQDDDRDGRTDCRDADCAEAVACEPGPEVCDDCFDNDRDGLMDCKDPDCATDAFCSPQPEACDNTRDDDGDRLVDLEDPDCAAFPLLAPTRCPAYALYFGPEASPIDHALEGEELAINLRNLSPVLAFRLCVERSAADGVATYAFTGSPGSAASPTRNSLLVVNDYQSLQSPATPNRARGAASDLVVEVRRGAALEELLAWDFLAVAISPPPQAGPCFSVDYVSDLNIWSPRGIIPPARAEDPCHANEVLRARLAPTRTAFLRGDADASSRLNIADAIVLLGALVGGAPASIRCDAALDVNGDGSMNLTDPIVALGFLFRSGESPAAPFPACGVAPATVAPGLVCLESNCN